MNGKISTKIFYESQNKRQKKSIETVKRKRKNKKLQKLCYTL